MADSTDALHAYLLDPLERASSTFVQQFVVLLLATGSAGLISYQDWGQAADVAGFAAIISIITSVITFGTPKLDAGADLVLRVVKTGLQSFLAVLASDQITHSVVHADWKSALAVAIPVMLTALLKGLASLAAPWSDGASLLPASAGYTTIDPDDYADADPDDEPVTAAAAAAADPSRIASSPDSIAAASPAKNGVGGASSP